MKKTNTFEDPTDLVVGDLVRLKQEISDSSRLASQRHSWQPFIEDVQLTPEPCGFGEKNNESGLMGPNDVGTVIEFSDCSKLNARVSTARGFGWIPTAFLERA